MSKIKEELFHLIQDKRSVEDCLSILRGLSDHTYGKYGKTQSNLLDMLTEIKAEINKTGIA